MIRSTDNMKTKTIRDELKANISQINVCEYIFMGTSIFHSYHLFVVDINIGTLYMYMYIFHFIKLQYFRPRNIYVFFFIQIKTECQNCI